MRQTRSATRLAAQRRDASNQSRSRSEAPAVEEHVENEQSAEVMFKNLSIHHDIEQLPENITRSMTTLTKVSFMLLLSKQKKLRELCIEKQLDQPSLKQAAKATLVFAQEEAGTAICIDPSGLLLTCSHCVSSDSEVSIHKDASDVQWLLFASGRVVRTKCILHDERRDLALLQITAAQADRRQVAGNVFRMPSNHPFPHLSIADHDPAKDGALVCIGHPGSEDLEVARPGVKTGYDTLHVSHGQYQGLASDQDPQDNSEIGALQHDCWTYWGHSGAPLVNASSGRLIGLHSSWDDATGMRRGIPLQAVKAFLNDQVLQ